MQDQMNHHLLNECVRKNAIRPGNYSLLHAGGKETDYFDVDSLLSDYESRMELLESLERAIKQDGSLFTEWDRIAFLDKDYGPVGLLPYTSELSSRIGIEPIIVQLKRQHRLDHLRLKGVEYGDGKPLEDTSVLLIDDVVTTGSTQIEAIEILQDWGATVTGIVCVYNRNREDDALEEMLQDDSLDIEFAADTLSHKDCERMGVLLSDNLQKYVGKDTLEQYQSMFDMSGLDEEQLHQKAESEVENVIREAIEQKVQEFDQDISESEKKQLVDDALSSFNDETREALEQFTIDVSLFEHHQEIDEGNRILEKTK